MKRRTFDGIVTLVGFGLSIFLFIAAGLLNWGFSFANSAVANQLSSQSIMLPADTGNKTADVTTVTFFKENGNKLMSTGKQAQMYADHYIGFHLSAMPTYAKASAASRAASGALAAAPNDPALQAAAKGASAVLDTVFKGTTLRGTLLTAYAFWQLGQIAAISAGVALVGGLLMLILSIAGWMHLRRTPEEATI
ncbi:unannotated protein [freshwater metagenome]|uniref:Unannotated protein n=1 Tax=freshwater metagenome TaxID=449393 RepID=A0A6J6VRW4_9ZZZZ|nr:hypothetical protein [Actinomycetota bacterium]MSW25810.1 hypothetical protein [Actinomycetota bacterium]MSW34102.1 hypothetical protein [Actinomycetota bacterium]MSX30664.1 hypothetical protein [Actinomycetota bacterium]MSX51904.1 hypothetical protein [Actinomycetota bacterium]